MHYCLLCINNRSNCRQFSNLTIEVCQIIYSRFNDINLDVNYISSYLGYSLEHIENKVLEDLGIKPHMLIQFERCLKALEMLIKGNNKIESIALEVGYSTPKSFRRNFVKIFETMPHQLHEIEVRNKEKDDFIESVSSNAWYRTTGGIAYKTCKKV